MVRSSAEQNDVPEASLLINGKPVGVKFEVREGDGVATWPFGKNVVLVAHRPNWAAQGGGRPVGILWRADCRNPDRIERFFRLKGADFGNAALAQDGRTLYFTGPRGIMTLDLRTKKTKVVTRGPSLSGVESCWKKHYASDVVRSLSADGERLIFWRGGPCTHDGDWYGCEMVLTSPGNPGKRKIHVRHPVTGVAVDSAATVWVADGGRCVVPGIQDPSVRDGILRSTDGGANWKLVKVGVMVKGELHTMATAPAKVLTDGARAGHLLVLSSFCSGRGAEGTGGSVLISRDGGKTFAPLPGMASGDHDVFARGGGQWILDVALVAGSIDHLVVQKKISDKPSVCLETRDGGKTWQNRTCPAAFPVAGWTREVKGCRFRATADGLMRMCRGDPAPRRVYPTKPSSCDALKPSFPP